MSLTVSAKWYNISGQIDSELLNSNNVAAPADPTSVCIFVHVFALGLGDLKLSHSLDTSVRQSKRLWYTCERVYTGRRWVICWRFDKVQRCLCARDRQLRGTSSTCCGSWWKTVWRSWNFYRRSWSCWLPTLSYTMKYFPRYIWTQNPNEPLLFLIFHPLLNVRTLIY